jgi:quercetin dioxygenase-like cupin family protein
MPLSRRDLPLLFPALMAWAAPAARLVSHAWRYEDLPVKENGPNRSRAILNGATHTGFMIEMHETELAPGLAPHGSHHHVHDELVIVREGTLAVTINGVTTQVGPGSVVYVNSNEEHGLHNAGSTRARYWILTLGREST